MASYSRVFKAAQVSVMPEVRVLSSAPIMRRKPDDGEDQAIVAKSTAHDETDNQIEEILEEAKKQASEILANAEQRAHALETETSEKIASWWNENEEKLEQRAQEAAEQGYRDGFETGKAEAEQEIQLEYESRLNQIQQLLQEGYAEKQAIISEAEPFLLEMSTVIAEQILKQELEDAPQKFVELIKQQILRFKEKDSITVCVHPDDFEFIQSQRKAFISVVNGETEIKIIPDHSVSPKGCIIRSAYGSVDARIDTQMEEIKKAIMAARREPELVAVD